MIIVEQQAFRPRYMITLPEMAAEALGSFLASDMKDRFGSSHARLAELIPFAAGWRLNALGVAMPSITTSGIGMLVTLAGHDIFKGNRALLMPSTPGRLCELHGRLPNA